MLEDLFPASQMEAEAGEGGREMDCLVTELSCELIDDYPTADPRWAESTRHGQSLPSLHFVRGTGCSHGAFSFV